MHQHENACIIYYLFCSINAQVCNWVRAHTVASWLGGGGELGDNTGNDMVGHNIITMDHSPYTQLAHAVITYVERSPR